MNPHGAFAGLWLFDPETAALAEKALEGRAAPDADARVLCRLAIHALAQNEGFGRAAALGLARLAGTGRAFVLMARLLDAALLEGAAQGEAMARGLLPVLESGCPRLRGKFLRAHRAMAKAGTHTLRHSLDGFLLLMEEGDARAGAAYLELLEGAFSQNLSYHQCLYYIQLFPKLAKTLAPSRRAGQFVQTARILRESPRLAEPFAQGLEKGLGLLQPDALSVFTDAGLQKFRASPERGIQFFALESQAGQELLRALQSTAALAHVRESLGRYLSARLGKHAAIRPAGLKAPSCCSGPDTLVLPAEMDARQTLKENQALLWSLARLESGHIEFNTHSLDTAKAAWLAGLHPGDTGRGATVLARFLSRFPEPGLALALFTVFEHARVAKLLGLRYPGMAGGALADIRAAMEGILQNRRPAPLGRVYAALALDLDPKEGVSPVEEETLGAWRDSGLPQGGVEAAAALVHRLYGAWQEALGNSPGPFLATPFDRGFDPALFAPPPDARNSLAARIQNALAQMGVLVFESDLSRRMEEQGGELSADDLRELARPRVDVVETTTVDWAGALAQARGEREEDPEAGSADGPGVFWYKEWDHAGQDYLPDYCRLTERVVPEAASLFYEKALAEHQGTLKGVRKCFGMLKPESLAILRRWPEGCSFDHRALVEFAVDRSMGKTPGGRVYVKRVKIHRDVAVMLLVDLSRSTDNLLPGKNKTVLDVEKEAIVLFCEALKTVGDPFAIAGFSGAGRLRADFYWVKKFAEPMDMAARRRVSGMAPARNTRMGAAIRHAARALSDQPSRARLLVLLGDGFPNDLDYKGAHAVEDTKAAIREARSQGIRVHAITVNLPDPERLDRLYGGVRHNLISDAGELPRKLPRIYRALTA
jgi:hypothetical protein